MANAREADRSHFPGIASAIPDAAKARALHSPFGSSGIESKADVIAADLGTGRVRVSAKAEHKIRELSGASRASGGPRRLLRNARSKCPDRIANNRESQP